MRQEELRRELKQQQTLQDKNNIFVDTFDTHNVDEETPIFDKLVHMIDQVSAENFESNDKLMDWSTRSFDTKAMVKFFITIAEKVLL